MQSHQIRFAYSVSRNRMPIYIEIFFVLYIRITLAFSYNLSISKRGKSLNLPWDVLSSWNQTNSLPRNQKNRICSLSSPNTPHAKLNYRRRVLPSPWSDENRLCSLVHHADVFSWFFYWGYLLTFFRSHVFSSSLFFCQYSFSCLMLSPNLESS